MTTEFEIAAYLSRKESEFRIVEQTERFASYLAQCPDCGEHFRTNRDQQAHDWVQDHIKTCTA